jgi:hypothetical protein
MAIEALNTLFPFTTDTGLFSTNFPFEIVLPDTSTYEIYYVPDLIWQNTSTAQVTVNYYGGAGGASLEGYNFLYYESGLTVAAAADFDGNGTPDLVWQNSGGTAVQVDYYGLSGGQAVYQNRSNGLHAGGSGWTVTVAADMNGDGVPDLIWQDPTLGVTVNFYSHTAAAGAVYQTYRWLYQGSGNSGWRVAAVADFDGNGTPDLVWQQIASPNAVTVNYFGPG